MNKIVRVNPSLRPKDTAEWMSDAGSVAISLARDGVYVFGSYDYINADCNEDTACVGPGFLSWEEFDAVRREVEEA